MLFWSGQGYLIVVIYFAINFLVGYLMDLNINDNDFYEKHSISYEITLFATGIISLIIGKYLNNRSEPKIHRFILTGDSFVGKKHTMFYVPMEYWGIAFIILPILNKVYEIFIK